MRGDILLIVVGFYFIDAQSTQVAILARESLIKGIPGSASCFNEVDATVVCGHYLKDAGIITNLDQLH